MSDCTKQKELERKARAWTIPYYKSLGYEVKEVSGKENRKQDLILFRGKDEIKIEEKARLKYYPDLLFEIVQCAVEKSWGWIYDVSADYIIYIFWNSSKNSPDKIYSVNWKLCKKFCFDNLEKYNLKTCRKGYGLTIFATILWHDLINEKIAKLIYERPKELEISFP